MDNQYHYGIVRNLDGQIVGFNLSPELCITFSNEDIFEALETFAKKKAEHINNAEKMKEGD